MERFRKKRINVMGDINIESNTFENVFDENKSKEDCQYESVKIKHCLTKLIG